MTYNPSKNHPDHPPVAGGYRGDRPRTPAYRGGVLGELDAYQAWAVSKLGGEHQEFACALGLAGEAGEVADLVKKDLCHGVPQARELFEKELGDVLYYLAVVAHQRGLRLSDVAAGNVRKLEARYPNGFNTADSIARRDLNATQTQAPKAPPPHALTGCCDLPGRGY